jgi:hypothetical protein
MKKSLLRIVIAAILFVGFQASLNAQNIFFEDFEGTTGDRTDIEEDLTSWTTDSLVGDRNWYSLSYNENLYAQMTSHNSGSRNEAWLITPAIDLSGSTNKKLKFDINVGYWTHAGLKVYLSTDFDGSNIEGATWIDSTSQFNIPQTPTDGYGTLSSAGSIDLSSYSGTIYVAFQYVGNDTSATDSSTTYQIDNLSVYDPTYPTIEAVSHNPLNPTSTDKVGISAEVSSTVGIDSVFFAYGSTVDAMNDTIGMILESGVKYIGTDSIPAQADGDSIYYQVTGINSNGDSATSEAYNYVTSDIEVLTIYDIQYTTEDSSAYTGSMVQTSGIVTASFEDGFFLQDGKGPWNGLYVYDNGVNAPAIGDEIQVIGEIAEYYNLTELKPDASNEDAYKVISSGNDLPAPDTVTTGEANNEKYEGVLITVEEVECIVEPNQYNEAGLKNTGDTLLTDDKIYLHEFVKGYVYNVTGVIDYSFEEYKILPRSEDDVELLSNSLPVISEVGLNPSSDIQENQPVIVTATVTDEDVDDQLTVQLLYGTSSDDISNEVNFSTANTGEENVYGGEIPGQAGGTTVYFQIKASDGDTTIVASGDYQVQGGATAIEDIADFEMKVYPNPGYGQYNLEVKGIESQAYNVTVYNAIGNLVYQKVISNRGQGRNTINLNHLSDGIYYLKVKDDNTEKVIKIVKQ